MGGAISCYIGGMTDSLDFIAGYGDTHTGSADRYSKVSFLVKNLHTDLLAPFRIMAALSREGSDFLYLISLFTQIRCDHFTHMNCTVVISYCDLQLILLEVL